MKKENKLTIELNDNKIKKILTPSRVIKLVENGFKKKGNGLVNLPPKSGPMLNTKGAFADSMTVAVFKAQQKKKVLDAFGIKWISVFNDNVKRGLPNISGIIILNDSKTGLPIGILNANYITAIRTAAVSAVCAKHLAPRKKKLTIGIFGFGIQAQMHVLTFKEIFKDAKFLFYEHNGRSAKKFKAKYKKNAFHFSRDSREVVQNSDIILSLTTFPSKISPYIFKDDLKKDVLILPVDYGSRIDSKVYSVLDEVYADDISQYNHKVKTTRYFSKKCPKIRREFADILVKKYQRSKDNKRILVFNLGIALFDVLAAQTFVNSSR